jgi:hypothetical protein
MDYIDFVILKAGVLLVGAFFYNFWRGLNGD